MLVNSFNYVVTKFILPTIDDLKSSTLTFGDKCEYLQENKGQNSEEKQYILDLIIFCRKTICKLSQITSLNHTMHAILQNEIDVISLQFPKVRLLLSSFIDLAY